LGPLLTIVNAPTRETLPWVAETREKKKTAWANPLKGAKIARQTVDEKRKKGLA